MNIVNGKVGQAWDSYLAENHKCPEILEIKSEAFNNMTNGLLMHFMNLHCKVTINDNMVEAFRFSMKNDKEETMEKLFVSVPMRGRSEEQIRYSIDRAKAIAEAAFNKELDLIPSYFPDQDFKGEPVACLGRALKMLSDADYFAGVIENGGGCSIEREVFQRYKDINNVLLVPMRFLLTDEELHPKTEICGDIVFTGEKE